MDFGSLPPEINSARIYAGPGSAPLLAAAASWDKLAAELGSAAAGYQSAVNSLVSEDWTGPAANSMAAAATPYVSWMEGAAARAEQTAAQAKAGAAAYEAARAASVSPAVVVANRSQLAALVATNFLGLNASAIAANEAQYGQMWAQDAAAMYGYAAASASASQVAPFSAPKQTTNPNGQANQDAAVTQAAGNAGTSNAQQTLSQTMNQITGTLQQLGSPLQQSGSSAQSGVTLPNFLNINDVKPGDVMNTVSNLASSSFSPMGAGAIIQTMADLAVVRGAVLSGADPLGLGAVDPLDMLMPHLGLGAGMAGLPGLGGGLGSIGTASASVGNASMVGSLSVPASWSSALPAATPGATTAATGWTVAAHAPEAAAPGMPGVPLGAAGRNYGGFAAPRYGFKPTVMARPVVAG